MISSILVPLDGSALSENALPCAETIAQQSGAELVLVRALPNREEPDAGPAVIGLGPIQEAAAYLQGIAERIARPGLSVQTTVRQGEAAASIIEESHRRHSDLIVMGTHGGSGLRRVLFGGTSDEVLRQAHVPVLMVPASCDHYLPSHRELRVLVPLDGSEHGLESLPAASAMAEIFPSRLILLEVAELAIYREQAEDNLEQAAALLRPVGRPIEVHVATGHAVPTIALEAKAQQADLIVMTTHGRSGLARLVLGSVATATLQKSCLPVLLTRPAAMREATLAAGHSMLLV